MSQWPVAKEEQLKGLHAQGLSLAALCEQMTLTKSACCAKLRRLGLPFPSPEVTWTDEKIEKFKNLYDNNLSYREIGRYLNMTRSACIGKATRLGLPPRSVDLIRRGPPRGPKEHKPRLKIVHGGLGSMRVIRTTETEMAALRCVPVESLNLTLAELPHDGCRYIAGEPTGACYCGNKVREGSSYCPSHHVLCRVAPQPHRPAYLRRSAA